ncbi:tRNA (adenosine(37)-N6)-dimethylallyltransferase MiaA [Thermodesulfobacteriota bacterium]
MEKNNSRIIIITGPTAAGKTDVSVDLAVRFNGEIVNCDSMQVYRYMDIGTAKPSPDERKGIPHHLLDIVDPDEEFNASSYREYAIPVIRDILDRKKACIIVGGTGLYVKSLLGGLLECPPSDPEIRKRLSLEYEEKGGNALYEHLKKLDPESASGIHPNDKIRVIRALEIIELTKKQLSELIRDHAFNDQQFSTLKICLHHERDVLYERINKRSLKMLEGGLIEETENLLKMGYSADLKPLRSIGYRHAAEYIDNTRGFDGTLELLQRDTRRYAKRQITWFRADPEMIWTYPEERDFIEEKIKEFIS